MSFLMCARVVALVLMQLYELLGCQISIKEQFNNDKYPNSKHSAHHSDHTN